MKIVYVIGYIHGWGGIERVLSGKANYLIKQGYDVSFVKIYRNNDEPYFEFDPRIKFYALDFTFEEEGDYKRKVLFHQNKKLFIEKLSELLNEIKPDITISTYCKYSKYIYLANDPSIKIIERHFAKYKRSQFFVKLDKYSIGKKISNWYRRKDYKIVKHYAKFVVLTHEDREDWGNLDNIMTIHNPMTFEPQSISTCENKRAIALGRISKQKNYESMLRIWKEVTQKHNDWHLSIFANGGSIRKLQKYADQLKVSSNITISPVTRDVEKELLDSSIYLMTSRYEGLPLVLLEAMSCGLPVVTYACKCGPKDMINNGEDGFYIEPNDEKSFVKKVNELIENKSLRLEIGTKAAQSVRQFSEDKIMKQWMDLFESLVSAK